jgi:hypothetical protein
VDYLHELGPDALPALRRVTPLLPPGERRSASVAYVQGLEDELREDLGDWRGWTLRRSRLSEGMGAGPDSTPFIAGSRNVVASAKRGR